MQRRLSAIFAADMVGYSRLMEADEIGTLQRQKIHRTELIDPALDEFNGRIVKEMGDGVLVEFPSVVEAVQCAVTIQKAMTKREAGVGEELRIQYRIGINLGDIVIDGGDIFGDGVNIAARLEQQAKPGGICISGTAYDQLKTKVDVGYESLGEIQVKNISQPIRAYQVLTNSDQVGKTIDAKQTWAVAGLPAAYVALIFLVVTVGVGYWFWQQPDFTPADPQKFAFKLPDKPSIAILPFDNNSPSPEDARLAVSISDDLTSNLAQISGLFVIARQATAPYKDQDYEIRKVAEKLGVRNVVFGGVRRFDNNVRVNVQLVDALSGQQIWTGRFEREITDIFELQDELGKAISTELADNLTWSGGNQFTNNVEAHLIWLSAQDDMLATSSQRLSHARALAKRAIQLDPNYSRGYALLGLVETQSGYFGYVEDRNSALESGLELAKKAVNLSSHDWYSQFVYAQSLMNVRDYEGAVTAIDKAIELDPSNAFILSMSALPLTFLGQPQKAISRLKTAMRLNPYLTWMPPQFMGQALYLTGDYEAAIPHLEKAAELNPRFIGNLYWRAASYAQLGQIEKANGIVKQIQAKNPNATISGSFIKIQNETLMEQLRDGWRKAGLPE